MGEEQRPFGESGEDNPIGAGPEDVGGPGEEPGEMLGDADPMSGTRGDAD